MQFLQAGSYCRAIALACFFIVQALLCPPPIYPEAYSLIVSVIIPTGSYHYTVDREQNHNILIIFISNRSIALDQQILSVEGV